MKKQHLFFRNGKSFSPFGGRGAYNVFLMALVSLSAVVAFSSCNKDDDKEYDTIEVYETADAPPHAASNKVWKSGDQIWSDAIQIPECNKQDFDGGREDEPLHADGRSYTHESKTYYYYSWSYVNENAGKLCPSPWRVPTKSDFITLADNVAALTLRGEWRLPGYANGNLMVGAGTYSYYWASTEFDEGWAYELQSSEYDHQYVILTHKYYGLPVRCVR